MGSLLKEQNSTIDGPHLSDEGRKGPHRGPDSLSIVRFPHGQGGRSGDHRLTWQGRRTGCMGLWPGNSTVTPASAPTDRQQ